MTFFLTYSAPATATLNYEYADRHPVMTEIKGAYSKRTKVAPARFKGTDKFILAGTLPNWLILYEYESGYDVSNPKSYTMFPKEGFMDKIKNPEAPWEKIDVQISPKSLYEVFIRPLTEYYKIVD